MKSYQTELLLAIAIASASLFLVVTTVQHKDRRDAEAALTLEIAALYTQTEKVARYERIIYEMMDGQWSPEMGICKEFEEEWYGTPIWVFTAHDLPPGAKCPVPEEIVK